MTRTRPTSAPQPHPGRSPRHTTRLLMLGALAGPCYIVVSLIQAFTRDGFDLTRHAWSMLANGEFGWIQSVNLIVSGLLVIVGAAGVRRTLQPGPAERWAPRLLAVYGLSMVMSGLFRADPGRGFPVGTPEVTELSSEGVVHFAAGGIGFPCLAAAGFILARRFAADGERSWSAFSRLTAAAFLVGSLGLFSGGGSSWSILLFIAAITVASAWLTAVLLHYRQRLQDVPTVPYTR